MTEPTTELPFSPRLHLWFAEACNELNLRGKMLDKSFAIFPSRFYEAVASFNHDKAYDFCFIGAFMIDDQTKHNRAWMLEFIAKNFTKNSYLQFTDRKTKLAHQPLGEFDYTLERDGFVPKESPKSARNFFDEHYYETMCKSKFTLCPAGDENWSIRFYEALMCKSIPILHNKNCFRTYAEATLDYLYFTVSDRLEYRVRWVEHNYNIFLAHHTLRALRVSGG